MIRIQAHPLVKSNISSLVGIRSAATLAADFTSSLPFAFTFTRASDGTYVNSSGVIVTASTDAARFDYDPVTLAARGLLIEGARTNLFFRSAELGTAPWFTSGANATVSADVAVAPDGNTATDQIVENTASAIHRLGLSGITMTAVAHAVSGYFYKVGARRLHFNNGAAMGASALFDLTGSGAVIATSGAAADLAARIEAFNATYYRAQLVGTGLNVSTTAWFQIARDTHSSASSSDSYTGDGASGFAAWGTQCEAGAFASSYIPTTTAAVTRAADAPVSTGATFAGWYRQDQGTFVIEADSPGVGTRTVFQVDDGTANNRIVVWTDGTTCKADIITGGVSQTGGGLSLGAITAYTAFKVALAFRTDDVAACITGGAVQTDTSVTLPTVDRAKAGASTTAGDEIFGHVADVTFFPGRRSDNFLSWAVL